MVETGSSFYLAREMGGILECTSRPKAVISRSYFQAMILSRVQTTVLAPITDGRNLEPCFLPASRPKYLLILVEAGSDCQVLCVKFLQYGTDPDNIQPDSYMASVLEALAKSEKRSPTVAIGPTGNVTTRPKTQGISLLFISISI